MAPLIWSSALFPGVETGAQRESHWSKDTQSQDDVPELPSPRSALLMTRLVLRLELAAESPGEAWSSPGSGPHPQSF